MGRFQRYRKSLANHLLFHKLLELLERAGILIEPYYFYEEHMTFHPGIPASRARDDYEFFEAEPADTPGLAAINLNKDTREEILNEFRLGRHCFALRLDGRIIASSWCDTNEIHFPPCRRDLMSDEAYIYRTEVLHPYRGCDVASYLRTRIYAHLASRGRELLYSYTDMFNRPAVRFKEKIGANVLFHGLSVRIPGLGAKNWVFHRRNSTMLSRATVRAESGD